MRDRIRISKFISYLLRHNPMGLEISEKGFVNLDLLIKKIKEKYPWIDRESIKNIVREDKKGRFEIIDNHIRARYGHSLDVSPVLPIAEIDFLYHGTSKEASNRILKEGLKPIVRKKVHLSFNVEDAITVGKRKTEDPVILKIDAKKALAEGIRIEKASEKVYVAQEIPKEFISLLEEG
jgi:putative RNA 2'-phosphotransferase